MNMILHIVLPWFLSAANPAGEGCCPPGCCPVPCCPPPCCAVECPPACCEEPCCEPVATTSCCGG